VTKISDVVRERWEKAFPLAGFGPVLQKPSEIDIQLAQTFCPQLYINKKIISDEREYLSRNLENEKVDEALFLFSLGYFPEELTSGELRIVAPILKGIVPFLDSSPDDHFRTEKTRKRLKVEYQKISKEKIKDYAQELFEKIIPKGAPTCVIKYRVVRSETDPNILCIQYFTYWPIQLFPLHFFDYEPVYVFVRYRSEGGYEPLLITYNANPGTPEQLIKPLLFRKRPGHVIRTFINWEPSLWDHEISVSFPNDYNRMADYMTEAYGGEYLYERVNGFWDSHTDRIIRPTRRPMLQVRTKWHAYESCPPEIRKSMKPIECKLHPLKTLDLMHIEWDVRNPFQAPFLYPIVGKKKDPLMHLPFEISALLNYENYQRWNTYASISPEPKRKFPFNLRNKNHLELNSMIDAVIRFNTSRVENYRNGLLIDIFRKMENKTELAEMWKEIDFDTSDSGHGLEHTFLLDEMIRQNPDDAIALRMRGEGRSISDPEYALEDLDRAVKLDPDCIHSRLARVTVLSAIIDPLAWYQAEKDLDHILKLEPNNVVFIRRRAAFFFRHSRDQEAIVDVQRILELDPSNESAQNFLKKIYETMEESG